MPALKASGTEQNLKDAFAGESQANRRYLYFARQADIEGYPEAAGVFKNTADGETGHAFGHLEFMEKGGTGDPGTGLPIGETSENLKAAVAGETYEYTEMYPGFAATAREEGLTKLPNGLKHWLGLKNPMPVNFRRPSIVCRLSGLFSGSFFRARDQAFNL